MNNTGYDALKFWLDVGQWIVTLLLALFMWLDHGRKDNRCAIKELSDKVNMLDKRVQSTEDEIRHIPTHDDIAHLQAQTAALASQLERVTNTVDRIHDHIIKIG